MKQNVMERLNQAILEKNSRIVAGLDPKWENIPRQYYNCDDYFDVEVFLQYCLDYVDAVKDIVPAIKINSAFFEKNGCEEVFFGVATLASKLGLIVIGDLKRADIGSTSQMYAKAYLYEGSPFDIMTINPYFGTDSVKPFVDEANKNEKGLFVLVKTSNQSSSEIQDLFLQDGRQLYEAVGELVKEWGYAEPFRDYSNIGAVVGATHPSQAKKLREMMPNTFFLVPGYGAQGASAKDVAVNFDSCGLGAIVNSSRGIMQAYKHERWNGKYSEKTWKQAARAEALRATKEINEAIFR